MRAEMIEPTVNQVADKAEGLIKETLRETGKQLDDRVDKLTKALNVSVDKLTEAVERLNPGKLLWQAGLVFGLVNVATVIAAIYIAKHM